MADIIPAGAWADGEEVNALHLYQRIGVPVNTLNNQVQQGQVGDSGSTVFALGNSWVSQDGGTVYAIPQWSILNGFLVCDGAMKSGTTGTTFATLPAGALPAFKQTFLTESGAGGGARISITAAGLMTVDFYTGAGANTFVMLSGIVFRPSH